MSHTVHSYQQRLTPLARRQPPVFDMHAFVACHATAEATLQRIIDTTLQRIIDTTLQRIIDTTRSAAVKSSGPPRSHLPTHALHTNSRQQHHQRSTHLSWHSAAPAAR